MTWLSTCHNAPIKVTGFDDPVCLDCGRLCAIYDAEMYQDPHSQSPIQKIADKLNLRRSK